MFDFTWRPMFFFFSYTSFEKWLSVKWILSGLQQVLYSWLLLNKLYRIHYHTVSVKGRQMKYFHSTERVVLLKTTVFRSKTIYNVLTTCLDHLTVVSSKKRSKITSNSATCHPKQTMTEVQVVIHFAPSSPFNSSMSLDLFDKFKSRPSTHSV